MATLKNEPAPQDFSWSLQWKSWLSRLVDRIYAFASNVESDSVQTDSLIVDGNVLVEGTVEIEEDLSAEDAAFSGELNVGGDVGVGGDIYLAGNVITEYQIQARSEANTLGLTSVTDTNVTASPLVLGTGIWEISGALTFLLASTTTLVAINASVSRTSGTGSGVVATRTNPTNGEIYISRGYYGTAFGSLTALDLIIPTYRVTLEVPTTLYLVARCNFAISTLSVHGYVAARKV